MNKMTKIKNKKGFTLAEILITVAVIAILGGVAFVAGNSIIKNMRQTALDKMAETIYLAADRNLQAARFAGDDRLLAEETTETKELDGDYKINLGSGSSGDPAYDKYYYKKGVHSNSSETIKEIVLPADSVSPEIASGKWYITYAVDNSRTYRAVEVFCTTSEYCSESEFSSVDFINDQSKRTAFAGSDKEHRDKRNGKVGWFKSEDALLASGLPDASTLDPAKFNTGVKIINNEELGAMVYIKLPSNDPKFFNDGDPDKPKDITYTLKITGVSSNNTLTISDTLNDSSKYKYGDKNDSKYNCYEHNGSITQFLTYVPLDSLSYTGLRFNNLVAASEGNTNWQSALQFYNPGSTVTATGAAEKEKQLIPGEDILVTVTATCEGTGAKSEPIDNEIIDSSNKEKAGKYGGYGYTNSLFAKRAQNVAGNYDTVQVDYGRHLQNLDKEISQIPVDSAARNLKVIQRKTIDFALTNATDMDPEKELKLSTEYWKSTYDKSFAPIINSKVISFDGGVSFDGKGDIKPSSEVQGIKNLKIDYSNNTVMSERTVNDNNRQLSVGMFSCFSGEILRNIALTGADVASLTAISADDRAVEVGILAGYTDSEINISNVTVKDSIVVNKQATTLTKGENNCTGGVIGRINQNATINNCNVMDSVVASTTRGFETGGIVGLIASEFNPSVSGVAGITDDAASTTYNIDTVQISDCSIYNSVVWGVKEDKPTTVGGLTGALLSKECTISGFVSEGVITRSQKDNQNYSMHVGGMCGLIRTLNNTTINSCYVRVPKKYSAKYIDAHLDSGFTLERARNYITSTATSLEGVSATKTRFIQMTKTTNNQKLLFAGGLVGNLNAKGKGVINNSYASSVIWMNGGAGVCGGLVGSTKNYERSGTETYKLQKIEVNNSYADCYMDCESESAGGLVAECGEGSSFTNCYSAGLLINNHITKVAGITTSKATLINCYSLMNYDNTFDTTKFTTTTLKFDANGYVDNYPDNPTCLVPSPGSNLYALADDGSTVKNSYYTYDGTVKNQSFGEKKSINELATGEITYTNGTNDSATKTLGNKTTASGQTVESYELNDILKTTSSRNGLASSGPYAGAAIPNFLPDLPHYGDWLAKGAAAHIHNHYGEDLATANASSNPAHKNDAQIPFQPWSSNNSLPSTAGNYYLTTDVTISGTWPVDNNINICLNGHAVNKTGSNNSVVKVNSNKTLQLCDCDKTTTHTVSANYSDTTNDWTGTRVVTGGVLTGGVGNSTLIPGGVNVDGGTFKMYGGNIAGNRSREQVGGVCVVNGGNFYLYEGNIIGNASYSDRAGGGVWTTAGHVYISGGEISENSAGSKGGGLGIVDGGTLEITGGVIKNNVARSMGNDGCGGGIFFRGSTGIISGGKIIGNTAERNTPGGGICLIGAGTLEILGGEISGNTATKHGGGIGFYNNDTSCTLKISGKPIISGNSVNDKENNIHLYQGKNVVISDELEDGAKIGVSVEDTSAIVSSGRIFTTGYNGANDAGPNHEDPDQYFFSDNKDYTVCWNEAGTEARLYSAHKHNHYGDTTKTHNDDLIVYKPWTSTTSLPTSAGNYYLKNNVTLSNTTWTVPDGECNICLNGYAIIENGNTDVIKLSSNRKLNICDCDLCGGASNTHEVINYYTDAANDKQTIHGGVITRASGKGRGIYVSNTSILSLYGGSISGHILDNSTDQLKTGAGVQIVDTATFKMYGGEISYNDGGFKGGGVYQYDTYNTFELIGGTIKYNKADWGGGVYVWTNPVCKIHGGIITNNLAKGDGNDGSGGIRFIETDKIYLSGKVVIENNKNKYNGVENDSDFGLAKMSSAYNDSGKVHIDGELKPGSHIGIYAKDVPSEGRVFTIDYNTSMHHYNTADPDAYFFSDQGYQIGWNEEDTEACIYPEGAHLHNHYGETKANGAHPDDKRIIYKPWNSTTSLPTAKGNYYLTNDITLSETARISSNINLCLNGHEIRQTINDSVINVNSGARLTVCDCDKENGLTREHNIIDYHRANATDTMTVKGGVITGGKGSKGGGVYCQGTFEFYGGMVAGNTIDTTEAYMGGAGIYNAGGTVVVGGNAVVCDNKSARHGGGLYAYEGTITIQDEAKIYGNIAEYCGGGLFSCHSGVLDVKGGYIRYNMSMPTDKNYTPGQGGGGIHIEETSTLKLSGGQIENNVSTVGYGGGIGMQLTDNPKMNMSGNPVVKNNLINAAITGNYATGYSVSLGTESNTYIRTDFKVGITGEMKTGASVGINMQSNGVFTTGYDYSGSSNTWHKDKDPADYFFSDDLEYEVIPSDNNEAKLAKVNLVARVYKNDSVYNMYFESGLPKKGRGTLVGEWNGKDGGNGFLEKTGTSSALWQTSSTGNVTGWNNAWCKSISSVTISEVFWKRAQPKSMETWFKDFNNLTTFVNLNCLDVSAVTSMKETFFNCWKYTGSYDLSGWETTTALTDMTGMFGNDIVPGRSNTQLGNASSISFGTSFETQNVTSMKELFAGQNKVESLTISMLDFSSVTDMEGMFSYCPNLTTVDLHGIDTSSVTNMPFVFAGSIKLATITGIEDLNVEKVTDLSYTFCNVALTALDLSKWKTTNLTNTTGMFYRAFDIIDLNVGGDFNTSKVTKMSWMFDQCLSLTTLDLSNFDTGNVTEINGMFAFDNKLETIYASNKFTTDKVDPSKGVTTYEYGRWNGDNTTNYRGDGVTLHTSNGNANNYDTSDFFMFYLCTSLTGGNGTKGSGLGDSEMRTNSATINKTYAWIDGRDNNPATNNNKGYFTSATNNLYARIYKNTSNNSYVLYFERGKRQNVNGLQFVEGAEWNGKDFLVEQSYNPVLTFGEPFFVYAPWNPAEPNTPANQLAHGLSRDVLCVKEAVFTDEFCKYARPVSMKNWFSNNEKLEKIDFNTLNTSNVKNMAVMFKLSPIIEELDLSSFDTKNVVSFANAFHSCTSLKRIYVSSDFVTTSAATIESVTNNTVFGNCYNLVGGNKTSFNSEHISITYAHIDGGSSNPGYFTDISAKPKASPRPSSFLMKAVKYVAASPIFDFTAIGESPISEEKAGETSISAGEASSEENPKSDIVEANPKTDNAEEAPKSDKAATDDASVSETKSVKLASSAKAEKSVPTTLTALFGTKAKTLRSELDKKGLVKTTFDGKNVSVVRQTRADRAFTDKDGVLRYANGQKVTGAGKFWRYAVLNADGELIFTGDRYGRLSEVSPKLYFDRKSGMFLSDDTRRIAFTGIESLFDALIPYGDIDEETAEVVSYTIPGENVLPKKTRNSSGKLILFEEALTLPMSSVSREDAPAVTIFVKGRSEIKSGIVLPAKIARAIVDSEDNVLAGIDSNGRIYYNMTDCLTEKGGYLYMTEDYAESGESDYDVTQPVDSFDRVKMMARSYGSEIRFFTGRTVYYLRSGDNAADDAPARYFVAKSLFRVSLDKEGYPTDNKVLCMVGADGRISYMKDRRAELTSRREDARTAKADKEKKVDKKTVSDADEDEDSDATVAVDETGDDSKVTDSDAGEAENMEAVPTDLETAKKKEEAEAEGKSEENDSPDEPDGSDEPEIVPMESELPKSDPEDLQELTEMGQY